MRQRSVVVLVGGELDVDALLRSGFAVPLLHLVAEGEGRRDTLFVEHGVDLLIPPAALLLLFRLPRTPRQQRGQKAIHLRRGRKSFSPTMAPARRSGTASASGSIFTGGSSSSSLFTGGREERELDASEELREKTRPCARSYSPVSRRRSDDGGVMPRRVYLRATRFRAGRI
ncbi:hypothetical protein ZWY2020_023015 [Hordeum vulgare]|nr:hypothetical protein ZWY2020_023015 [Hordeum vulgare]